MTTWLQAKALTITAPCYYTDTQNSGNLLAHVQMSHVLNSYLFTYS